MECSVSTCTRAEAADLAQVVAPQVHQHVVLGQLLFVGKKLLFKRLVLLVGFAPRPRARQREGVQHAVLQLDQRFRATRPATSTSVPEK